MRITSRAVIVLLAAFTVLAPVGNAAAQDVTPNIVDGHQAPVDVPWIATVQTSPTAGTGCTASLIAPRWVITAGHCMNHERYWVRVGSRDQYEGGEVVEVEKKVRHPDYDKGADVGLFYLSRAVDRQPLRVAEREDLREGQRAVVFGWGSEKPDWSGPLPRILKYAVGTASRECSPNDGRFWNCFQGDGSIAGGDSGGPLVVSSERGGAPVQAGVCSVGQIPAESGWGGYTDLVHHREWIRSVAGV